MEYNFSADFLAKFSSFSDPIKGLIILSIAMVVISFLYFTKTTITEIMKLIIKPFLVSSMWKNSLKEIAWMDK